MIGTLFSFAHLFEALENEHAHGTALRTKGPGDSPYGRFSNTTRATLRFATRTLARRKPCGRTRICRG